jgi:hypothetical protein
MLILRSLLVLLVLLTPALGQDGSRIAATAQDAAQALKLYLQEVADAGQRPDYTKAPAVDLFRQVFDLEQLTILPPPRAGDMVWVLGWVDAANETYKRILGFGAKPGPDLDQEALVRNWTEYEDQYALALTFLLRGFAREATTLPLFWDQLTPDQRTPIRAAGLQRARSGGAQLVETVLGCVAVGMRPANARLITAAARDTGEAWANFILPKDRIRIIDQLGNAEGLVKDDDVRQNLAVFRAHLAAAHGEH